MTRLIVHFDVYKCVLTRLKKALLSSTLPVTCACIALSLIIYVNEYVLVRCPHVSYELIESDSITSTVHITVLIHY